MITNITLENFKCFRRVSINSKLLTVLIGPNGTGKSSILQALLLLGQWDYRNQVPRYEGQFITLSDPEEMFPAFSPESVLRLSIGGETGGQNFQFAVRLPDPEHIQQAASQEFLQVTSALRFVPAARGLVRPSYALGSEIEEPISLHDGLATEKQLATNLAYCRGSEETLSALLKKVTGTGFRVDAVPPQSVAVKSLSPAGPVNIVSEGFGANALIQLLYQLVAAEKGATVLIEEPEIHLHPRAQAELGDVLADTAKAKDKQMIMTTHSEHLVERLLLLVAEGTLTPDDLAIYSFSKDEDGECFAVEIEVTGNGQVGGGLTDFYANNLDTLDRRVKALKRSQ